MQPTFENLHVTLDDGDRLALHLTGGMTGGESPILCIPGGPMLSAEYLGDLGNLGVYRPLALLDNRGSGQSDAPANAGSYRCDRVAVDLDSVRRRLGLAQMAVLAHSAGANIAYRYAEKFPDRVERLVLVTPSPIGVGIDITVSERRAVLDLRAGEPWYDDAVRALDTIQAGRAKADDWTALAPASYGTWDAAERAYAHRMDVSRKPDVVTAFAADGAYDPQTTRAALGRLTVPVMVLAGEYDVGNPPTAMGRLAGLFAQATFVVQPAAGHYPWRDDPAFFGSTVREWLDD